MAFGGGAGLAALFGMKLHLLALSAAFVLAACDHSGDAAKDPSTGAASACTTHDTATRRTASTAATPVAKKVAPTPTIAPTPDAAPTPQAAPVVTTGTPVPTPADGTVHEHVDDSPTALSQGNSLAELKITAGIRRAVMWDGSLGFGARNVQIITVGTKVTLRGLVNSDRERSAVESHAKQQAGVSTVDDLIALKN